MVGRNGCVGVGGLCVEVVDSTEMRSADGLVDAVS